MVETLLLSGKAAFGVVGLATGIRLGRMARSDEGLGSHALGAAIIFVGAAGLGLAATGGTAGFGGALATTVSLTGDVLERLALLGLAIFVWKVFRPDSGWAAPLVVAVAALLGASHVWELRAQAWPDYDAALPSAWGTQLAFAVPFGWSAIEAGLEWSRGRRKLALGLTDAGTVHRFAIWSLACAGFVGICALAIVAPVARESGSIAGSSVAVAVRAGLYFAVAGAIWIGMFAPQLLERSDATQAIAQPAAPDDRD